MLKQILQHNLRARGDLAIENVDKARTERFCYQRESKVYIVPIQDIIYFESSRRIVKIYTNGGTDIFYSRLNDIEKTISGDFIRIHQSYLVNPRYIASLNGSEIQLTNGSSEILIALFPSPEL